MTAEFVAALRDYGLNPTAEDVADILWLAASLAPVPPDITGVEEMGGDARAGVQPPPQERPTEPRPPADVPPAQPPPAPAEALARESEHVTLYRPRSLGAASDGGAPAQSIAARMPAPPPESLALGRALRTLARTSASRALSELDEAASADLYAELRRCAPRAPLRPVLRPRAEPWLDVALVFDDSPTMAPWQPRLRALRRLFESHRGFRDVRVWTVDTARAASELQLRTAARSESAADVVHSRHELVDPTGRRLILFVSDCFAAGWWNGAAASALQKWSRSQPVAVVQALPRRMWPRTAVERPFLSVRSARPTLPTARLLTYDMDGFPMRSVDGVSVPIVELRPRMVESWAQLLAGVSAGSAPAVVFPSVEIEDGREPPPDRAEGDDVAPTAADDEEQPATSRELVSWFRASASPAAQRLATYLVAVAPITLGTMRFVQQVMISGSGPECLAELLLSGLLNATAPTGAAPDRTSVTPAAETVYEFLDGVREELVTAARRSELLRVMDAFDRYLGSSEDETTGLGVLLPSDAPGASERIPAGATEFMRLSRWLLDLFSGRNAAVAASDGSPAPQPSETATAAGVVTTPVYRILVLDADARLTRGEARTTVEECIRSVVGGFQSAANRELFEFTAVTSGREIDLVEDVLNRKPHIVHLFDGGGPSRDRPRGEYRAGRTEGLSEQMLQALLRVPVDAAKVVVLDGCFARDQAQPLTRNFDYVVGIKTSLAREIGIRFIAALYEALAAGDTLRNSYTQAATALVFEALPADATPELLVREGISPDVSLLPRPDQTATTRQNIDLAARSPEDVSDARETNAAQRGVKLRAPDAQARRGIGAGYGTRTLPPRVPEYLNIDLEIGVADGSGYPVHVLASPGGQASGILRLPNGSTSVIAGRQGVALGTLRGIDPPPAMPGLSDPESVRAFGQALMEALFADALRRCYDVSLAAAADAGTRLRLRLRILDPALSTLPWEFLFDRYQRDYLVLGRRLSLVRYLEAPIPAPALGITPPLRILALAAGPSDLPALDIAGEKQRMAAALAGLNQAGLVEVTWLESGSWRDLLRAMRDGTWHTFHFSGHGGFDAKLGEGVLAFVGDNGKRQLLQAQQVGRLLAGHPTLRLVVLNACQGAAGSRTDTHSSTAAALVKRGVPAVIALQNEISDEAAIEFGRSLYEALADELPVDAAVAEARISVSLARRGSLEWGTPALFMRAADSALFRLTAPPQPPTEPEPPPELPPCPYRGLSAFREQDAASFFGRGAAAMQLFAAVQDRGLTALIGASSGGKSSLVFAGLLPQLRTAGGWLMLSLRPDKLPLTSLAEAIVPVLEPQLSEADRQLEEKKIAKGLREGQLDVAPFVPRMLEKTPNAQRLLLVVDQFEELYTLCRDDGEREAFIAALLKLTDADGNRASARVVLTLRADFYGEALAYRPLADALQTALLQLRPMTQDELEQAIVQPARQVGVRFEAGLVDRILTEIDGAAGQLPLLQFALTNLWDQQKVGSLTHAAYEAMGGVRQALPRYAETVFAALSAGEQSQAQRVFLQLVQPGEQTADTRRRATRAEVGAENWDVVTKLADARLVVTGRDAASGQDSVEVVHGALIDNWARLRVWVNSDRSFRLWQEERLRTSVRQWNAYDRDSGALLRGAPLAEAEQWLAQRPADLSPEEQEFIKASLTERERGLGGFWRRLTRRRSE
jgi:hypothetical protein